jgi:hypothetical protein
MFDFKKHIFHRSRSSSTIFTKYIQIQSQDTEASVSPSCSTSDSCSTSFRNDNDISDKCNIWCSKRPNATDQEATLLFLNLRDKYATDFDDKKHIKSQLWKKIAKEMADSGFKVGEGKEAVEKLRQKFANLQKQYLKHIQHVKQTGEEKREPPPFFNEMHGILGHKDKSNPKNLQDTLEVTNDNTEESENEEVNLEIVDKNVRIKNRFSTHKTVRPASTNYQLINLLKEQHAEDKEQRQKQFSSFENILLKQTEQRERLLDQFERLIKQKRKRTSSSDSE